MGRSKEQMMQQWEQMVKQWVQRSIIPLEMEVTVVASVHRCIRTLMMEELWGFMIPLRKRNCP